MKFAHGFKETLANQGFPHHWVKQAIPYSELKKCLKRVQRELQDLGLDPDTLRALLNHNVYSPVALRYKLKATNSSLVRPKLTVHIHMQDGVAVDARPAPTSRHFSERIAAELPFCHSSTHLELNNTYSRFVHTNKMMEPMALSSAQPSAEYPTTSTSSLAFGFETIEVPLVFDSEFFGLLQSDVYNLDVLQADEERKMTAEVVELGREVSVVSRPSRFCKNDLARWRYIFELYLDAEVFFATGEVEHGTRPSQKALEQLQWFQEEVNKRRLARDFKRCESKIAFSRFLNLNASLLQNLQFQELNKLAIVKILKKFDKHTSLGVSRTFPLALQTEGLLSRDIAKDVCAQMSRELVSIVPQLNDYLCPIQRRNVKHCPLCRADVVLHASAENLDHELQKYMKKYFNREVKEKQRVNEIERGIEDYGPGYTYQACVLM
ncbi:hypothetical protein CDD83_3457 [Cordyceps sp. RAO-2017]|nr:hypothetical protein CDD83_3457 [Cordyceps sp. RAO-2017]